MNNNLQFMEKIQFNEIDKFLDDSGNSIIIHYEDLIELIASGDLKLMTKNNKSIWLDSHIFNYTLPRGIALLDSNLYNYGENTIEVILP